MLILHLPESYGHGLAFTPKQLETALTVNKRVLVFASTKATYTMNET